MGSISRPHRPWYGVTMIFFDCFIRVGVLAIVDKLGETDERRFINVRPFSLALNGLLHSPIDKCS